jgi:hypothetical protein
MKFCPACGEPVRGAVAANPEDNAFKSELHSDRAHDPQRLSLSTGAPALPSEISQYYLPVTVERPPAATGLLYQPRLYAGAEVNFVDKKKGKVHVRVYRWLTRPAKDGEAVRWATGERVGDLPSSGGAEAGAHWIEVPEALDKARKLKPLEKAFADHLYNNARLVLFENAKLGLVSAPGEDVLAFRGRCRNAAAEEAAREIAAERANYEPKFAELGVPMPEGHVREEESLLDYLNPLNLFRAAPRAATRDKVQKLHSQWLSKQADIVDRWKKRGEEYSETTLSPRRPDVRVTQFGLAWAPFWRLEGAGGRLELVAAYHPG